MWTAKAPEDTVETTRKAPYAVYNDGTGPYAMFTCESCGRDYRAQPVLVEEVKETIAKSAFGGFLRNIPIVGDAAANQVDNDRYRNTLTTGRARRRPAAEVKVNFAECQSCRRIVCIPDFDMASGFCKEDSPRSEELQARGCGAGRRGRSASFLGGIANAFGIPDAMKAAAAQQSAAGRARCGAHGCARCGAGLPRAPPAGSAGGGGEVLRQLRNARTQQGLLHRLRQGPRGGREVLRQLRPACGRMTSPAGDPLRDA